MIASSSSPQSLALLPLVVDPVVFAVAVLRYCTVYSFTPTDVGMAISTHRFLMIMRRKKLILNKNKQKINKQKKIDCSINYFVDFWLFAFFCFVFLFLFLVLVSGFDFGFGFLFISISKSINININK